nr:hypothetical protein [uncultured Lichenicoccus sp.]
MAKKNATQAALEAALRAGIGPRVANDAAINLRPVISGVTKTNWQDQKPKIAERLAVACKGKLAKDASLEDVVEMLDQLDDVVDDMPDDVNTALPIKTTEDADTDDDAVMARLKGKVPDDVLAMVEKALKGEGAPPPDVPPAATDADKPEPAITKAAMDAMLAETARKTEAATIARLQAIDTARAAVRDRVGEVNTMGMDSADAIYKFALDAAGVDTKDVHASAYPALVKLLPRADAPMQRISVAQDAARRTSFAERFPNANRLSR